jgi:glycogen(starch) synthase
MKKLLVSVVINTMQRDKHLAVLLKSLFYQRYKNFEVIVVIGPNSDESVKLCEKYKTRLKILRCHEANLSQSRNIGISASAGDVVAFIDDDAIPEPDWLLRIATAFNSSSNVGVFGGALRDNTGFGYQALVTCCDRFGSSYKFKTASFAIKQGCVDTLPGKERFLTPTGANSAFLLNAIRDVGGFDEFFEYFLDETDLCLRILEKGYRCVYDTHCEVIHKYAPSHIRDERKIPKTVYQEVKSVVHFIAKHASQHYSLIETNGKTFAYIEFMHRHITRLFLEGLLPYQKANQLHSEVNEAYELAKRAKRTDLRNSHLAAQTTKESACAKRFFDEEFTEEALKICFICRDFKNPKPGGITVWTKTLANELAEIGHEVSIIYQTNINCVSVDFEDGCWLHGIPSTATFDGPRGVIPQALWDWSSSARDEAYRIHLLRGLDIVSAPIWDLEGIAIARSGWLKLCTSLHTTYEMALSTKAHWQSNELYMRKHVLPVIAGELELINKSSCILANSRAIVNDVYGSKKIKAADSKLKVIPHGIPEISPIVKNFNSTINIIFIGRFEERKGVDLAVSCFRNLLDAGRDVTICMAGDTAGSDLVGKSAEAEAHELARNYPDRFKLLEYVDSEKILDLYQNAHVLLAPSRYESFGLIYIEAMRSGCIPIGLNVGGVGEVIINKKSGLLVDAVDLNFIDEAINNLLNDADEMQKISKSAIQSYHELYTSKQMAVDVAKFYSSVGTK